MPPSLEKWKLLHKKLMEAVKKNEREEFLENLIAATCPEYLLSIKESRAEYVAGNTTNHDDVFK